MNSNHSLWQRWVDSTPDSCALITPSQTLNWRQLNSLVEAYSRYLHAQGLSKGDVLTVVGKNRSELVVAYLASLNLGILVAMTMPQPINKLNQKLTTLYADDQRRFVAFTDTDINESVQEIDAELIALPSLDDVVGFTSPDTVEEQGFQTELASIVFTSGSTGNPKAVAHTTEQHIASASGLLEQFKFSIGDTWLLSLPMYHVSGLAIVYRWLVAGATLKIGDQGLDKDIEHCTHASLVATQLRRLLESKCPLALSHVLLGGSHIPNSLALEANRRGITTWLGYGMTEAASTVTAKPIDEHDTAGAVLAHRTLKVVKQRIYIGGKTLASGYYYQRKLTPLVDADGWFDSKDLGEWVGDQISIIGRADNQFISGGENIHCEEIEQALNQLSAVRMAMIIPVEDNEFGFRPVAIIDCDELPSKDEFERQLQGKLERFKFPVAYYRMPSIEQSGIKVSRAQLAAWLNTELTK